MMSSNRLIGSNNMKDSNNMMGANNLVFECVVHGRIPLMISEYCHVGCIRGGAAANAECRGV